MEKVREIRTPVRRKGAERFVLLSLVSFAISVIFTRLFLQLTGYPQLGNSELHIAHVLWGGLILFIAALLPLILSNRWAFNTSAILSGVGVGLFIDEVGKFITQSNDYFYPPAAPIIYTFFLLVVLLYIRVRLPPVRTPRAEMYRILEELTEVVDSDLDEVERSRLEARLANVSGSTHDPSLQRLADALYQFLKGDHVHMVPRRSTLVEKISGHITPLVKRIVTRSRLKGFLVFTLGAMGVIALIEFALLLIAIPLPQPAIESIIRPLVTGGELRSAQDAAWFLVRVLLEGFTGIMLVVSGGLIITGRERTGTQLASAMLVIWLTMINLLVFYFDQFGAVITALVQFFVLMLVTYYRRKYLSESV